MARNSFILTFVLVGAVMLGACDRGTGGMSVSGAFSRATPPGAKTGVLYLELTNSSGRADRLLGVGSSASESVELHETSMVDGVMRMRQLDMVDLPDGKTTHFAPEGRHFMMTGLKAPLVEGTTVDVTLRFEHSAPQTLRVPVLGLGATSPP